MPLDLTSIRSQFPALKRDAIYLDNPAGTQVARSVLDRMNNYLVEHNANHEGAFATSRESDALVEEAHQAAADFLNAGDSHEDRLWSQHDQPNLHVQSGIGAHLQPWG